MLFIRLLSSGDAHSQGRPFVSQRVRVFCPTTQEPSNLIKQTSRGLSKSKDGHQLGGTTRACGLGSEMPLGHPWARVWSWGSGPHGRAHWGVLDHRY